MKRYSGRVPPAWGRDSQVDNGTPKLLFPVVFGGELRSQSESFIGDEVSWLFLPNDSGANPLFAV